MKSSPIVTTYCLSLSSLRNFPCSTHLYKRPQHKQYNYNSEVFALDFFVCGKKERELKNWRRQVWRTAECFIHFVGQWVRMCKSGRLAERSIRPNISATDFITKDSKGDYRNYCRVLVQFWSGYKLKMTLWQYHPDNFSLNRYNFRTEHLCGSTQYHFKHII